MNLLHRLWRDEAGFILSAEAALITTMGVIGATVGLHALATSINEELIDVAYAFRSLDQSYSYKGFRSCGAMTAGSSFQQEPVELSLAELCAQIDKDEKSQKERLERLRVLEEKQKLNSKDTGKKPEKKPQPKKKNWDGSAEAGEADQGEQPASRPKVVTPYQPPTA